MLPILGGFGAAVCWATAILATSRAARAIGAPSTLAGVMLVGLAASTPFAVSAGPAPHVGGREIALLAVAGIGNVVGLLLNYTALRTGNVSIVAPVTSTEGAIGAAIAILFGEPVTGIGFVTLAAIVVGVVLASTEPSRPAAADGAGMVDGARTTAGPGVTRRAVLLSIAAATCFGINLYALALIGQDLPLAWAILPARVVGVAAIALPLLLGGRFRMTRRALPFVVLAGIVEVLGIAAYTSGARAGSIAVASVTSSQFAAIAAVAAFILFRERLARVQVVGVATIAVGVALLAVVRS